MDEPTLTELTRLIDVSSAGAMPGPLAHPEEGDLVGYVGVAANLPVYLKGGRLLVFFADSPEARIELVGRILKQANEAAIESFGEAVGQPDMATILP